MADDVKKAPGNNINDVYRYSVGGKTYTVDPASQGGYIKAYKQYQKDRRAQYDSTKTQVNKTYKQNNETTNANYDNSARQAYVDYMRRQRALPSQLQALGVNGGATESGLLNLYNNYGVEHAANEQQRNAELGSNRIARDDAINSARDAYLADLNDRKQTAISNQINEYNNEVTRFSSTVAQYPTTEGGYDAYVTWINRLSASNDPLKDIKVALVRQQLATQFPDGRPDSSSGDGGGYSGGGGGGYSGGGGGGYSYSGGGSSGGGGGGSSNGSSDNTVGNYYSTGNGGNRARSSGGSKSYRGGSSYTLRRNLSRGGIW